MRSDMVIRLRCLATHEVHARLAQVLLEAADRIEHLEDKLAEPLTLNFDDN